MELVELYGDYIMLQERSERYDESPAEIDGYCTNARCAWEAIGAELDKLVSDDKDRK